MTTTAVPTLSDNVRVFEGYTASTGAIADWAARADSPIVTEAYKLVDSQIAGALGDAAQRGVPVTVLANRKTALDAPLAGQLRDAGVRLTGYGNAPADDVDRGVNFLHSKAFAAGSSGIVTTAYDGSQVDLTFEVEGAPAQALDDAIRAAIAAQPARIRDSAEHARQHGIVINDPLGDVRHIDESIGTLIRRADSDITVVMKALDDPAVSGALARAHRLRDVDVNVMVPWVGERDWKILTDAGITPVSPPNRYRPADPGDDATGWHGLHANAIFVDGAEAAYVGSRFVHDYEHLGRDMGVLLGGQAAEDARAALEAQLGPLRTASAAADGAAQG